VSVWQESFVAATVLLGRSCDDAMAALAPSPDAPASVATLEGGLRDPRRAARAAALARAGQAIVLALEETGLR